MNARPRYAPRLGRSVVFLSVLALGVVISTLLAGLVTYGHHALAFRLLAQLLAVLANIGLYFLGFRVLTPKGVQTRQLLPGAIAGGVFWSGARNSRSRSPSATGRPTPRCRTRRHGGRRTWRRQPAQRRHTTLAHTSHMRNS